MKMKIKPQEATTGMFIQAFDGNWISHPFWRSRFLIETTEHLDRIRASGVDLIIDTDKGLAPAFAAPANPAQASGRIQVAPPSSVRMPSAEMHRPAARAFTPPKRLVAPKAFGKADRARAIALANRTKKVVATLFSDCRLGRVMSTDAIAAAVNDISTTLEQNSAAFVNVTRLRSLDDETYTHSVAVCALMVGLARDIGLSDQDVQELGVAGLVHDIGKLSIDEEILRKPGAHTAEERAIMQTHTKLGHAMLASADGLPQSSLDVCLHHHERLDGSGYPFGHRGESISRATRIATICDIYDAMTADRVYKKGMTPADAVAQLDRMSDELDTTFVFHFMRSIGVYPPGKLIRLRSNRLAVVLSSKGHDLPIARAFYATKGNEFIPYCDTVLSNSLADDQAISAEDPSAWFNRDWTILSEQVMQGRPVSARVD